MLVKICGITNESDARIALDAGADWIGLNLVAGPRQITLDCALRIIESLDAPNRAIALLRAEPAGSWPQRLRTLANAGVGGIQCYGDAGSCLAREAGARALTSILVHHVFRGHELSGLNEFLGNRGESRPDYLLMDTGDQAKLGGTGQALDWAGLAAVLEVAGLALPPILLAGGLTPNNVAQGIAQLSPAGVDVSSGVEIAPGRKDAARVRAFVSAARGG